MDLLFLLLFDLMLLIYLRYGFCCLCLAVMESLPFDDSEYPYVGLPRIVIRTEDDKEIVDRENYVNAKFQIFGQDMPKSRVYDMVIRG